ncbi:putative The fantastic four family protein [Helianthus annuus]|uniref:The fantastic four family protein n=1 Tax=Helianthus annuus TaxID=4232 RepID=A0A9K3JDT6_HELAN|nr:protein FANTASTIC FOUR 3-like [Helianthus annuus]KAF5813615.1 putative The fantastic four family protein [Helianthus annuus]KAJ0592342.1 putative The fantastic four family protein [Helianthus annuus]KAJ0599867.1 putative The fantastic four family protein [Helianthus annuus]KAJ0607329.1 putative The fantastic four family protein [Helianthus annuus]KAJ0767387.1 putative The fantastic four family protein [Helianthus annuus]
MSTILCRQPSMNSSHVVEATTMTLKLVLPESCNKRSPFENYFNNDINSYLYHPKSFKLSEKSLELCTESLGSETGSDMSDDDANFAVPISSLSVTKRRREKKVLPRSFPPPLMTMSGSKLFQVRPHREGGRLIIDAIETDLGNSCLRAERSKGRFKLTCWKDEEGDLDMGSHEIDMKDSEKFQRVRRCNENENGDKRIGCNWEPSSWVAIS